MLSHEAARGAIVVAYQSVFGEYPNRNAAQIAQAIALYESAYGDAAFVNQETGERISGTNNWGAVHCKETPPCPEGCFEATDTHADGTKYQACFRRFAAPADGAKFFIRALYIGTKDTSHDRRLLHEAAKRGDYIKAAELLNVTGYSERDITSLKAAVTRNLEIVSKALNEPMPARKGSGRWPLIVGLTLAGLGVWYLWGASPSQTSDAKSET